MPKALLQQRVNELLEVLELVDVAIGAPSPTQEVCGGVSIGSRVSPSPDNFVSRRTDDRPFTLRHATQVARSRYIHKRQI